MSFASELQHDRKLRTSFLRAIIIVGTLFFLARLVYGYISQYGRSLEPILQSHVQIWPLIGWSLREAALGVLSAWFGTYVGWRSGWTSEHAGKASLTDESKPEA